MMTSFASVRIAMAGLVVAAAGSPALADVERSGVVLGGSIDGGNMGCQTEDGEDCGDGAKPAGGFTVHAGGMIAPRLALLGEFWGMAHTEDDLTASQVLGTVNLRGWVAPRVWLQGGLGVARSKISYDDGLIMASNTSSTVPAASAALGIEVIQARNLGLDVQVRAGSGLYRDDVRIWNAALGVGLTFF